MARKYEHDTGGLLPIRAVLEDGTEIRLVPRYLTHRPLYASKKGGMYSLFCSGFKQSKGRIIKVPQHPKKGCKQHKAYQLSYRYKNILAHHAVLSAWVCPRPEGMECDHINGDSLDNRLCNLEWVTHQENMRRRAESYNRKGKGFNGQPLCESTKRLIFEKLKGKKLLQLEINFEE